MRAALAALLLALAGATEAAGAESTALPRAVVLIDGSGSMRADFGDGDRIGALKAALAKMLPDLEGRIAPALLAFGHRRKNSCSDIETLLPAAPLDAAAFAEAVSGIRPRGRAPLADSLAAAADLLAGPEGSVRGNVLVIADGTDTCKKDPCAVAEELAAVHASLAIHVLAIAPGEGDVEPLQCVARKARGTFQVAESPEQLDAALAKLLERVSAPPVVPQAVSGPPALRLAARLGKSGAPLESGLSWRIRKAGPGDTPGEEVYAGEEAAPRVEVPPGRYLVEAMAGPAVARAAYDVGEKGTVDAELALEAGILSVRALANDGQTELQNVYFTLYKTDASGAAVDTVAVARDGFPRLVLLPGTYRARVEHGLATVERSISLEAGSDMREDVILRVGRLALEARSQATGELLSDVVFTITEDDPATAGGVREVARSAARNPIFTLPAGLYHVQASLGEADARVETSVRADLDTLETVKIASSSLLLSSRLQGETEALDKGVSYRIERIDAVGGPGKEILTTSRAAPEFHLPAGRYAVTGRLGPANAAQRIEVELRDGRSESVLIEHDAGLVALRAKDAAGISAGSVFWEIVDSDGEAVWSAVEADPRVALKPGAYRVDWAAGARQGAEPFTLAPGEQRTIEISTE